MTAPARFKQSDLERALRSFQAVGLTVGSVSISPAGEIVVHTSDGAGAKRVNTLDRLLDLEQAQKSIPDGRGRVRVT